MSSAPDSDPSDPLYPAEPAVPKEAKGAFGLLFLAIFIDLLGFGIIIPILPFLVQDIDPDRAGILLAWLLTAYSLAQFLFAPLWGRLSDRIGRRPVILTGLIGSAFSFALFAFVSSYELYMVTRAVQGIFTAASLPTARAYIADITPPADRARKFGLLGAAFGIGFTFGPAIGSLLSLDFFQIPGLPIQASAALFAAVLALGNFVFAIRMLPESLPPENRDDVDRIPLAESLQRFFAFFTFPGVGILLLIFGITTLIFSGFESMFPLFANFVDSRLDEENIGFFFAAIGLLVAGAQSTLVGPTVDRFGEERTLLIGLAAQVLGYIMLSFSFNIVTLFIFLIPLGIGAALVNPTINSAISNRIPANQQGGGLGINSSVGSLGRVLGPLYGGYLYDNWYPAAPYSFGSIIILVVLILTVYSLRPQTR